MFLPTHFIPKHNPRAERRCFRAPFRAPVLLLGSLSQGQLLQELGNECPDFFSLVPHTLKGPPNYI